MWVKRTKTESNLYFLELVLLSKHILFCAFTNNITEEMKRKEWQEITKKCKAKGVIDKQTDYTYVCGTYWANIKRATLAKRSRNRGSFRKLNAIDLRVLEILKPCECYTMTINDQSTGLVNMENNIANDTLEIALETNASHTESSKRRRMSDSSSLQIPCNKVEKSQLKRKKLKLEIENLEVQIYKTKLEILSLEKELKLQPSKYTKEINK